MADRNDRLMAELIVLQSRFTRTIVGINTGVYKKKKKFHGTILDEDNRFTEEELLDDELRTVDWYIEQMQKCLDDMEVT